MANLKLTDREQVVLLLSIILGLIAGAVLALY